MHISWRRILFIALGLGAAAPSLSLPPATERPADTISAARESRGRPERQWVLHSDGSGELRTIAGETSDFFVYPMLVRRFQATPADFHRLRALLRPAEHYADRELQCQVLQNHGPYGHVMWSERGRGWRVDMMFDCFSAETPPVHDAVQAADRLIDGWAEGGPGERVQVGALPELHSAALPGAERYVRALSFESRPCAAPCPVYRIEVNGDGSGLFTGRRFTAVRGRRAFRVSPQQYADFVAALWFGFPPPGQDRSLVGRNCHVLQPGRGGAQVEWRLNDGRRIREAFDYGCNPAQNGGVLARVGAAPDKLPVAEMIGPARP
jgi:hypothetical protein